MFVQREIKRFLRQVCGLKSDDQVDQTRDGAKYFVSFFDADHSRGVDLDEFCKVFLDGTNFSTYEEANTLLTAILSAFRDYRIKRAADPERAAKLTEMLDQLYEKGKKKHVCSLCIRIIHKPRYTFTKYAFAHFFQLRGKAEQVLIQEQRFGVVSSALACIFLCAYLWCGISEIFFWLTCRKLLS